MLRALWQSDNANNLSVTDAGAKLVRPRHGQLHESYFVRTEKRLAPNLVSQ